jgi:ribosomal protein S6
MFLFDPTFGATWENCENEIRRMMDRAEGEIVFCKLWDERRLCFRIKGRKRGVYVLVYFKAPPGKIGGLERDAQLSEHVLRLMVLKADGLTPEAMERIFVQTSGDRSGDEGRRGDDRGEDERESRGPRFDRKPDRQEAEATTVD